MKTSCRIIALLVLSGWAATVLHAAPPYRLATDNKIKAQVMVTKLLTDNPELLSAGMHCVPPGGSAQTIVASTLNVIGKPSDPPDVEVGQQGETIISPIPKVPKLAIMMPLHDRAGKLIGALALAFKYPAGENQVVCFAKAMTIRDEVAKQIPSLESLFVPTP